MNDDPSAAYDVLSNSIKATVSREDYIAQSDAFGEVDSNRATFIDRVEGDETQVTVFLTVEEYYGDGLGESYSSQRTVRMVHEDGWKIDEPLVGLEPAAFPAFPDPAIGDEPMQTVRRLYLYLMSGISLGVLLVGLNILLTVVLHALGIGRGELLGGSESDRQALSLAAALIVVGLLVWGVHWLLVERSLRADNPQRDAERGAGERALYFTLVLAVLLVIGVLAGTQLVEELTSRLFAVPRQDEFFSTDLGASLATVVVTGSAWAYHVAIRQRDLRAGPLTGAGAWMPRVYLYGAALAGLVLTAAQRQHAPEHRRPRTERSGARHRRGRLPRAPGLGRHCRDHHLGHRLAWPLVVRHAA